MNGFGSSLLSPKGLILPNLDIHIFSLFFLSRIALSEFEGDFIKSRTKQVMLFISPGCPGWHRCLPTGLSGSTVFLVTSPTCSLNRVMKFLLVWPTYCLPHVLHCIQYIMLCDIQQAFFRLYSFFGNGGI